MNNVKITSIIALSALMVTITMPSAFAGAGTVESYYWQANPEMCYLSSELDNLDFEDTTSQSAAIESELEDSRAIYNAEMNGITIDGEDSTCNGKYIEVGAISGGIFGWLGQESTTYSGTSMLVSYINFNTDQAYGDESNQCWFGDYDIEWVMNHEMGHGIGLKHHAHASPVSVMHPQCTNDWAALQTTDDTAIDVNYS